MRPVMVETNCMRGNATVAQSVKDRCLIRRLVRAVEMCRLFAAQAVPWCGVVVESQVPRPKHADFVMRTASSEPLIAAAGGSTTDVQMGARR